MTLFLVGYMGSGKSIVGRELAKVLNYQFMDFDDYIETHEGEVIADIFKSKGEIYFRKLEMRYLETILEMDRMVVALGGGTPCYGNNMTKILEAKTAQSVYLKTTIPTLVDRLMPETTKRPLIAHLDTKEALTEFIGKHLFERAPFYERSQYVVMTDGKTVTTIVESMLLQLF